MSKKQRNKFYQKGLSLIEASMVLVLSAVVVAGVMVYYQTAQNNNNLDRLGSQVMHILSEINGLYANGKRANDGTDYTGLTTESILAAVNDTEKASISDGQGNMVDVIKTAFPNSGLQIGAAKKDAAGNYDIAPKANANRFAIKILGVNTSVCTKLMAMNYGPQLEMIEVSPKFNSSKKADLVPATAPLSQKVQKCLDAANSKSGGMQSKQYIYLIMK